MWRNDSSAKAETIMEPVEKGSMCTQLEETKTHAHKVVLRIIEATGKVILIK